ncbi:MAG: hypothetical protein LBJ21_08980 [Acidobacteriota bacterium]|jgi:hypothetical protein|nr:hypothetical protein [Acidobacteriota bacterium]
MKNYGRFGEIVGFFIIISALFQITGAVPDVRADDINLPKGTKIVLHLNDTLSTASNAEGDEFTAVVANPVYIGDRIAIPQGSVVTGSVSRILHSDRLKGKAVLDLMLQSIRVTGRNPSEIAATLVRIDDPAGSGETQAAENFAEREKSAGGAAKPGGNKIGVRVQSPGGKNAGIGVYGGLFSFFSSQGGDVRISRGASMEITLDRPLTLTEETKKPAR